MSERLTLVEARERAEDETPEGYEFSRVYMDAYGAWMAVYRAPETYDIRKGAPVIPVRREQIGYAVLA